MKYFTLALLLVICIACDAPKKDSKTNTTLQTNLVEGNTGRLLDSLLTPYIETLRLETDNTAGMAIGVTKGDAIVFAKTFGLANIETKTPATFKSKFHIASISKPFTAAAIAKLIQQQKVALEDPIIKYIPEFSMKTEGYQDITIKHILTHTSGIPRHISSDDWLHPNYDSNAVEENIEHVKEFELDFKPGTQYNYSNAAFDILGIVVARASGIDFDTYVETQILEPAGMHDSVYDKPLTLPSDWAAPYSYGIETQDWQPYPYTGKYAPSSGLQTTILDMCQWGLLHLGQGKHKEHEVLNKEHFNMLVTPYEDTPWGDKMGLGWFLQSYLNRPNIMHLGNDTGFEAAMYIYPKDSISITVLANRDFSSAGRISLAAAEILFGEDPKSYDISARYQFGKTYREKGLKKAEEVWNRLKKDTTDRYIATTDDILTAGAVLENGNIWKEADEILSYYLTKEEKSTYAWRLLGNTKLGLKDTIGALDCYRKALEINPNYTKATKAIQNLIKTD